MRQRIVLIMLIWPLYLLLPALDTHAWEVVHSFHTDITVYEDASLIVTETLKVRSERGYFLTGFHRKVPTARSRIWGLKHSKGFQVLEVLRDGLPETFQVGWGQGMWIMVGDVMNQLPSGERTYVLKYRLDGQVTSKGGHDVLTWLVTDEYMYLTVEQVSASVQLPRDASTHLNFAKGLDGPKGKEQQVSEVVVDSGGAIHFNPLRRLGSEEGFVISLSWPKGYVKEPDFLEKALQLAADNRVIPIGVTGMLILLAYYLFVWFLVGRGPAKGTIVVRYDPPGGMSPAIMRFIWKMGYDERCFTAALLNAIVKGHAEISDAEGEYVVTKKKSSQKLSRDEEKVIEELFPKGDRTRLEAEGWKVAAAASTLADYLRASYEKAYFVENIRYFIIGLVLSAITIAAAGVGNLSDPLEGALFIAISFNVALFAPVAFALLVEFLKRGKAVFSRGGARSLRIGRAIGIMIPIVILGVIGWGPIQRIIGLASVYLFVFLAIAVLINYLFYQLLKAPTRAGRALSDAIEGFREFLRMTEQKRMDFLNPPEKTPELFQRYLPYALAIDVEQSWSEGFSNVLATAALGEPGTNTLSWLSKATSLKITDLVSQNHKGTSTSSDHLI